MCTASVPKARRRSLKNDICADRPFSLSGSIDHGPHGARHDLATPTWTSSQTRLPNPVERSLSPAQSLSVPIRFRVQPCSESPPRLSSAMLTTPHHRLCRRPPPSCCTGRRNAARRLPNHKYQDDCLPRGPRPSSGAWLPQSPICALPHPVPVVLPCHSERDASSLGHASGSVLWGISPRAYDTGANLLRGRNTEHPGIQTWRYVLSTQNALHHTHKVSEQPRVVGSHSPGGRLCLWCVVHPRPHTLHDPHTNCI